MFRNDFRDENGGLAQMPEIYTAFIKGVELSGKWVIDDLTNVDHFEPDKDLQLSGTIYEKSRKSEGDIRKIRIS